MPLSIPAFVQYQAPMPPLRGLWNSSPPEGDRFVNAEIDWLTSPPGSAVQFQLAGSSPVAMSQVVALAVDNAASGADVQFIFPDSGFVLSIPARTSGVWPVFTNALMFYAASPNAILGDRTVFQAFNSMPPPVPVPPSSAQNHAVIAGIAMANGTTQLVPASVSGTLNSLAINVITEGGAALASLQINIQDGAGHILWTGGVVVAANQAGAETFELNNLNLRFVNGVQLIVLNAAGTFGGGYIIANAYYSQP
jgi:hypothetical protein